MWVVSGDGDSLSIGGNHLLHLLRRNVDVQFLLFNNEIYGLTKGQYSPTSRAGTRSPSTPFGSVDKPVSPVAFALGAGARFVARGIDTMQKQLPGLFKRAHEHKGTSFVEIFQNCIVYNDGVFSDFTEKEVAADRQLHLEHGKPMIFGKDRNLGIRLKAGALKLEVVTIGKDSVTEDDLLVHDEKDQMMATLLGGMNGTDMPVAIGILYCDPLPSYEEGVSALAARAIEQAPSADVNELLRHGHTWMVEDA